MKNRFLSGLAILIATSLASNVIAQVETKSWNVVSDQEIGFSIDFLEVGNPGNPPDDDGGVFRYDDGSTRPLGSVPYTFHISKYAITRNMIELADIISTSDGLGGPLEIPLTNLRFMGGETEDSGDKPATGVSWNHAARFVNWMSTYADGGAPTYRFQTQPGDPDYNSREHPILWEEDSLEYDPNNPLRSRVAEFALPSVDEWYKAAYHDASAGVTGKYFDYATGSDAEPSYVARGMEPHTAVFGQPELQGPAPVHLAGGASPYGTVGQDGNTFEYMESYPRQQNSVQKRGGYSPGHRPTSESHILQDPSGGDHVNGFRVVMVDKLRHDPLFGDLNDDKIITTTDLDLLSKKTFPGGIISSSELFNFDLNGDQQVTQADRELWIERAALTDFGDLDLNGDILFDDFLKLSFNFGKEGGYAEGDITGDGRIDFPDFLIMSSNYGLRTAEAAPEPSGRMLLMVGLLFLRQRRQTKHRVAADSIL